MRHFLALLILVLAAAAPAKADEVRSIRALGAIAASCNAVTEDQRPLLAEYSLPAELRFLLGENATVSPLNGVIDGIPVGAADDLVREVRPNSFVFGAAATRDMLRVRLVISNSDYCSGRHTFQVTYRISSPIITEDVRLVVDLVPAESARLTLTEAGTTQILAVMERLYGRRVAFYISRDFSWLPQDDTAASSDQNHFCYRCSYVERQKMELALARFLDGIPPAYVLTPRRSAFRDWPGAVLFVDGRTLRFVVDGAHALQFVQCVPPRCERRNLYIETVTDGSSTVRRDTRCLVRDSQVVIDPNILRRPPFNTVPLEVLANGGCGP